MIRKHLSTPPLLGTPPTGYQAPNPQEQRQLIAQGNWARDWQAVLFAPGCDHTLVQHCRFLSSCWIGVLEESLLEKGNLSLPVGLYHCTINRAIIGDQVAIHQLHYLDNVQIEEQVLLFAIDELSCSPQSCFGYGLAGSEAGQYGLELGNENGKRVVYPFPEMQSADAWCWSRFRDRPQLLSQFERMSRQALEQMRQQNTPPGSPGPAMARVGTHSVVKNCRSISGCWIGPHSYIKGANKLKNLSILSSEAQPIQIGEGVELVNGIIAGGCKIFYGSKAVRFYCDQNSQLKYGARLINSYLGANSTVSCGELLNSLLFPAHEQHHNNSFLIAASVGGQSNIAAGATIGSNHNSRSADGELLADRGFWPALNTSLKYNCRLAAFTLLAKGDYPAEIFLPLPFALLSPTAKGVSILPAYWFRYNTYALERNSWKFAQRDQRRHPRQLLHHYYLEADTAAQIAGAIPLLQEQIASGIPHLMGIVKNGVASIEKPQQAIQDYQQMLEYYIARSLLQWSDHQHLDLEQLARLPLHQQWVNCGGQVMPLTRLEQVLQQVERTELDSWPLLHQCYLQIAQSYTADNARYALYLGEQFLLIRDWTELFHRTAATAQLIYTRAREKRQQDLGDPFRQHCYHNAAEQQAVLGRIEDDRFLQQLQLQQQQYQQEFLRLAQQMEAQ